MIHTVYHELQMIEEAQVLLQYFVHQQYQVLPTSRDGTEIGKQHIRSIRDWCDGFVGR